MRVVVLNVLVSLILITYIFYIHKVQFFHQKERRPYVLTYIKIDQR